MQDELWKRLIFKVVKNRRLFLENDMGAVLTAKFGRQLIRDLSTSTLCTRITDHGISGIRHQSNASTECEAEGRTSAAERHVKKGLARV